MGHQFVEYPAAARVEYEKVATGAYLVEMLAAEPLHLRRHRRDRLHYRLVQAKMKTGIEYLVANVVLAVRQKEGAGGFDPESLRPIVGTQHAGGDGIAEQRAGNEGLQLGILRLVAQRGKLQGHQQHMTVRSCLEKS